MNSEHAKEVLRLYRPGTADANDPSFAEALALCERDAELKSWFKDNCAVYTALRAKFKQIAVPEGLKEQIIAERQVHITPVWQKAVLLAGAVAAVLMVVLGFGQWWHPGDPKDFAAYRNYVTSYASRAYYMQKETSDLDQIRQFLAQTNAIADYVLPANLQKNATAAGCVATTWQGKQFSMICFRTGRPLAHGSKSDLWLIITDHAVAADAPKTSTPQVEKFDAITAASWTVGTKTYVLATSGDEQLIRKFL